MNRRRTDGDETWTRLLNWTKGQKASERLCSHILRADGFKSIDPSHPLGGKDGLKDVIALKDNITWIAASFFSRGQKNFQPIKNKFLKDLAGVKKNNARGFAFFTNQELKLSERKQIEKLGKPHIIEIFHLERLRAILDSAENYGTRLDFLDIELSKEEQLSYFAKRDEEFSNVNKKLDVLLLDYTAFKKSIKIDFNDDQFRERTDWEIEDSLDEFTDRIWYNRHQLLKFRITNKLVSVAPHIWQGALKSAKEVEKKYGRKNLGPYSDFDWGMLNGKLSALRWILGDDWDMLDT
jgi:hypothetical protein